MYLSRLAKSDFILVIVEEVCERDTTICNNTFNMGRKLVLSVLVIISVIIFENQCVGKPFNTPRRFSMDYVTQKHYTDFENRDEDFSRVIFESGELDRTKEHRKYGENKNKTYQRPATDVQPKIENRVVFWNAADVCPNGYDPLKNACKCPEGYEASRIFPTKCVPVEVEYDY